MQPVRQVRTRSNFTVHAINPSDASVHPTPGGDFIVQLMAPTAVRIRAHNVTRRSVHYQDEYGNDIHKWFFTINAADQDHDATDDVVAVPAAAVPPRLTE